MTAAIDGWTHVYSGKVRELYIPAGSTTADAPELLIVASDRVSAFDHILSPGIPGKGELLTRLSLWWFEQLEDIPNHLVPGGLDRVPDAVKGRAMIVTPLEMFPVECVVRGYLAGSGWAEYQASQSVCGVALPAGLGNGDRLPGPIFTPAWKAPQGKHDENISFEQLVDHIGPEAADRLRALSLRIYGKAAALAESKGLIIADTKFEFGTDADGTVTLADEVLTSDSSRYWDGLVWETAATPQARMASFDKQIVRDWLSAHWDNRGTPPELPAEIVAQTAAKYRELVERLTA
ncbi:phosphoribosylaminoimidazolesuccinocarboxamide synthase [Gryllotalpicola sp.]|uniref:phosphoribosylaminoimidazolesuccinocarboxamide synthase n=1 Tax=Gryllotalpicola sp. TaxID=1932787 RepID=UPI00261A2F96|nr:phosphoribosylaminoimidazolesuccinocarboxamide synthase [Gryllotalpicola sp.]